MISVFIVIFIILVMLKIYVYCYYENDEIWYKYFKFIVVGLYFLKRNRMKIVLVFSVVSLVWLFKVWRYVVDIEKKICSGGLCIFEGFVLVLIVILIVCMVYWRKYLFIFYNIYYIN